METLFYAQPYDITASGFYFRTEEEYQDKAGRLFNHAGLLVEEFEIQFIDGEAIDAQLVSALGINQANFPGVIEAIDTLDEWDKLKLIIAIGECGYRWEQGAFDADDIDLDFYEMDTLRELAEHVVDEGLMGEIPEHLLTYFDYDALARDLGVDYSEICVAGTNYIYRCS